MSTKLEHSKSNSNKTNQLVLAKLEHSKSNSYITSHLCNMLSLTSVTLKSRSNQMIQPLVQELYHVLFLFWPPGGQAKNQTGPKFGL
jgi:hypothetical protein